MKTNNLTNLPVDVVEVVANPTLAGNETALNGIEIDGIKYQIPVEFFWCTYGTTTYSQVTQAINNNKIPAFYWEDRLYILSRKPNFVNNFYSFSCCYATSGSSYSIVTECYLYNNGTWGAANILLREVTANPTLDGTEADLTGIKVGNTKYKIPSGGSGDKLYAHYLYITNNTTSFSANTLILTTSDTAFTPSNFLRYLYDNNLRDFQHSLIVSGKDSSTDKKLIFRVYCNSSYYGSMSYDYYNADSSGWGQGSTINVDLLRIHDTVVQVANTINIAPDIHLYEHNISIWNNSNYHIVFTLYSENSQAFNLSSVVTYLANIGLNDLKQANGKIKISNEIYDIFGISQSTSSNSISVHYIPGDSTSLEGSTYSISPSTNFRDKVIQIL